MARPGVSGPADAALPLLDVVLAGEGRAWSGGRYCESEAAYRFRYAGHDVGQSDVGPWRELRVDLDDPVTGLRAEVHYRALAATGPAARSAPGSGWRTGAPGRSRSSR